MRCVLVTVGSAGDVIPFLAIAAELRRRGHDVELLTNPRYQKMVESHGVRFHPIGSLRDAERTEAHPDLWHPIRGLGVLWRHLCVPALRPSFERLAGVCASMHAGSAPVVIASPLALGARMARDALPIRLLTGYTAPMNLRSVGEPMFIGAWRAPRWLSTAARRGLWRWLDRIKLEPMAQRTLAAWRSDLGLPPIEGSTFGEWLPSPDGGLALFPRSFGPDPGDWPPVVHCGFPWLRGGDALAPEVDRFLRADAPAALVYPGSATRWAKPLITMALEALRERSWRVLIVTSHADQVPGLHAGRELLVPAVPFRAAFPLAGLVLHHGGIGTCAEALRARIPQLLLPSAYDQFDNALRVERMGYGRWLPLARCGRAAVGELLGKMPRTLGQAIRTDIAESIELDGALTAADRIDEIGL